MAVRSDRWFLENHANVVHPYFPTKVKLNPTGRPCLSYGQSSNGYDLRLSSSDFRVFQHQPGEIIDPKAFNEDFLHIQKVRYDRNSCPYFVIPGNSYALGVVSEWVHIPPGNIGIVVGKSTMARCGLIVNETPIEPGWSGHITLEFSNSTQADCKLYANEGICQLIVLEAEMPSLDYGENGKYQNQPRLVTLPRV